MSNEADLIPDAHFIPLDQLPKVVSIEIRFSKETLRQFYAGLAMQEMIRIWAEDIKCGRHGLHRAVKESYWLADDMVAGAQEEYPR